MSWKSFSIKFNSMTAWHSPHKPSSHGFQRPQAWSSSKPWTLHLRRLRPGAARVSSLVSDLSSSTCPFKQVCNNPKLIIVQTPTSASEIHACFSGQHRLGARENSGWFVSDSSAINHPIKRCKWYRCPGRCSSRTASRRDRHRYHIYSSRRSYRR
jgi:hypothetical protein